MIDEVVQQVNDARKVAEAEQRIRIERQLEHDDRMTTMERIQNETRDLVGGLAQRMDGMWWLIFDVAVIVGLVVALVMWWVS